MTLEKCVYYTVSRRQAKEEKDRGESDAGIQGFVVQGCYVCDGYDTECKTYYVLRKQNENNTI